MPEAPFARRKTQSLVLICPSTEMRLNVRPTSRDEQAAAPRLGVSTASVVTTHSIVAMPGSDHARALGRARPREPRRPGSMTSSAHCLEKRSVVMMASSERGTALVGQRRRRRGRCRAATAGRVRGRPIDAGGRHSHPVDGQSQRRSRGRLHLPGQRPGPARPVTGVGVPAVHDHGASASPARRLPRGSPPPGPRRRSCG